MRDHPEALRHADRVKIETRYARDLERAFGSPKIAAALDTMESLDAAPPQVLSAGYLSLVKRWGKASAAARQAAMREMGDAEGCYFEVERVPF